MDEYIPPTVATAKAVQAAFNYFNARLFDPRLSYCMIAFSRNANIIGGYYTPAQWTAETEDGGTSLEIAEIALNVNLMRHVDHVELYSTLVHEMVHHWQQEQGTPSDNYGEHNDEWADKAIAIGLEPTQEDGEMVGMSVATKLSEGSVLERVMRDLPEEAIFPWAAGELHLPDAPTQVTVVGGGGSDGEAKPKPRGQRSKYTCPICGLNAWAKPGIGIMCGRDSRFLIEQV